VWDQTGQLYGVPYALTCTQGGVQIYLVSGYSPEAILIQFATGIDASSYWGWSYFASKTYLVQNGITSLSQPVHQTHWSLQ
jgi:hypothetical protein